MRYDGGIRVYRDKEYRIPFTSPWSIGVSSIPGMDWPVIKRDTVQVMFEEFIKIVTQRGEVDVERINKLLEEDRASMVKHG